MRRLRIFAAIGLLLIGSGCQAAQSPSSSEQTAQSQLQLQPTGWVTDQAELLPPDVEAKLATRLQDLKLHTGHELAVVTVRSLGGQEVEQYSLELARRWGVGRKEYNDGVVLLVAPNERKVRIEVGRGLTTSLSDEVCQAILAKSVLPAFRAGDMPLGITAGVEALIKAMHNKPNA